MSKPKSLLNKYFPVFLLAAVFAVVIYLIVQNIGAFGNVLLVVLGFGAVVLVHEFGHFIAAKLSGIKVEAFSIGFPPVLAGIQRTVDGYRIRVLPDFFKKEGGKSEDCLLSCTVGRKTKAGETEYRIGLIPFGGFVKMLGQDDTGADKASDDPRSYVNKPVGIRMGVIAAGVFFNVISAIMVFMLVFLIGIKLVPAVVGEVMPNLPAARAGLKAGDEIIEIGGKSYNLDFMNIIEAAAFSDKGEEVMLKVRHVDGSVEELGIVAEQMPGMPMRVFGFDRPMSLTIAEISEADANDLLAKTGLIAGDRIKAVNGRDVQNHWQLEEIVQNALVPAVTVLAERTKEAGKTELIESQIGLDLSFANTYEIDSESELYHIYSMVPRLQITVVSSGKQASTKDKQLSIDIKRKLVDTGPKLRSSDIIIAAGDVANPTYKELRDVTEEYEDKELPIKVLRVASDGTEKPLTVTVVPERSENGDRVVIGIGVVLDAEHPVVAKTITAKDGPAALAIPRGAAITAVDGVRVSNFYDIISQIRKNTGQRITIDYRLDDQIAGDVVLDVNADRKFVTVKSAFSEFVPFEYLERLYKAQGPIDALVMGYRKAVMFVRQSFMTLQRFLRGLVSAKNFMGPVGIAAYSYKIVAEKPLIYYLYWLGLISAFIAVLNFFPLLPFDGGHIVFLLVEKIKGSPVSERVQGVVLYMSLALVGAFVLYVTFNDIVRNFFS